MDASRGTEPVIQFMEDDIVSIQQIRGSVDNYRQTKMTETNRGKQLVVYLSCDKDVKSGLVKDVELELRKSGVYQIVNLTKK